MKIQILKDDRMPAFGGWCKGTAKAGQPTISLNAEVHFGENHVDEEGVPVEVDNEWRRRTLVETLMHEFGHALEEYFNVHLTDEVIEEIASSYRGLSDDEDREGFEWTEFASDGQSGHIASIPRQTASA